MAIWYFINRPLDEYCWCNQLYICTHLFNANLVSLCIGLWNQHGHLNTIANRNGSLYIYLLLWCRFWLLWYDQLGQFQYPLTHGYRCFSKSLLRCIPCICNHNYCNGRRNLQPYAQYGLLQRCWRLV